MKIIQSQCHSVSYKSHVGWPEIEHGPRRESQAIKAVCICKTKTFWFLPTFVSWLYLIT